MMAPICDNSNTCKILIEAGANIHLHNNEGESVLIDI